MASAQKVFFHVDLDAFFASAEQLDFPELRGKPVIVGAALGTRGVVSACSYEARVFGIRSAMPMHQAHRLCPTACFRPLRMKRYVELSGLVMDILRDFCPKVRVVSIDEAFLDMGGMEKLIGPAELAAARLRTLVREKTGLSLSVGVAANPYVAKIASSRSKPDGLLIVPDGSEEGFMEGLELRRLWGAGDATQERFRELNLRSVLDLRALGEDFLKGLFGKAMGRFLFLVSRGQDPGIYAEEPKVKSVSTERTFEFDLYDRQAIDSYLQEASLELMYQLYRQDSQAYTINVKLRYHDFETRTVSRSMESPFSHSDQVYAQSQGLFYKAWQAGRGIRLLGIGLSGLGPKQAMQADLFSEGEGRRQRLESAIFGLEARGSARLTRAQQLQGKKDKGLTRPENDES